MCVSSQSIPVNTTLFVWAELCEWWHKKALPLTNKKTNSRIMQIWWLLLFSQNPVHFLTIFEQYASEKKKKRKESAMCVLLLPYQLLFQIYFIWVDVRMIWLAVFMMTHDCNRALHIYKSYIFRPCVCALQHLHRNVILLSSLTKKFTQSQKK